MLELFRKHTTLQRWKLLLYGFGSQESSWWCDIKAAPHLLLAANYIKQPCELGLWIRFPLPSFPHLAASLKPLSEFGDNPGLRRIKDVFDRTLKDTDWQRRTRAARWEMTTAATALQGEAEEKQLRLSYHFILVYGQLPARLLAVPLLLALIRF